MNRINPPGTIGSKPMGESAEKLETMGNNVGVECAAK
jgi:hypothetical protein